MGLLMYMRISLLLMGLLMYMRCCLWCDRIALKGPSDFQAPTKRRVEMDDPRRNSFIRNFMVK